jgi:hypothetical protein
MRFVFVAVLLIATELSANVANADPMTVGQLVARCAQLNMTEANQIKLRSTTTGDALDAGKCWGHLEAYTDLASMELPDSPHPLGVCPPYKNNISFAELGQMFLEYAKTHPADLQKPAASIAAKLLAEKFPCRK